MDSHGDYIRAIGNATGMIERYFRIDRISPKMSKTARPRISCSPDIGGDMKKNWKAESGKSVAKQAMAPITLPLAPSAPMGTLKMVYEQ